MIMYALDFEYDGQLLSDYGFIICDFNSSSGADIVTAGSQIVFNIVSRNQGKSYGLTSTQYDECISATFDICKNPDLADDLRINDDEYRDLFRWLNRNEFLKCRFVNENEDDRYYDVSFNISKVKIGEILYGIELAMVSNRPFAYGEEKNISLTFGASSLTSKFYDTSDEIGYIRPYMTITCLEAGNLTIQNTTYDCKTLINNCSNGEVIYLDNENQIIKSSNESHDICHDFNYDFFKIGNTYSNRENNITVSIPCKIDIRYSPIIKDSP